MLIRDAQAGDFEAIAAITNPYVLKTAVHFGYEPVTAGELRASWEKLRGTHPFLVMVDEAGAVAGYAKAGVWRERAAYARTAEVGIYLREDVQGRGWGKKLYSRLIEACRDRGMHSVIGGITLPNEGSVRLHESMGFVSVGVVREAGWKFEGWHDVGFWQLML